MRTTETEGASAIDRVASRRDVLVVTGLIVRSPRGHRGVEKRRSAVDSGDHEERPSLRSGGGGAAAIVYVSPDAQ